jgi:hypothetical protein
MIQTAGSCRFIVPGVVVWDATMNNLFDLTDESLLAFYESVRRQVTADDKLGGRRLAGATMKEYANRLKSEMDRRRLHFQPIDWPLS